MCISRRRDTRWKAHLFAKMRFASTRRSLENAAARQNWVSQTLTVAQKMKARKNKRFTYTKHSFLYELCFARSGYQSPCKARLGSARPRLGLGLTRHGPTRHSREQPGEHPGEHLGEYPGPHQTPVNDWKIRMHEYWKIICRLEQFKIGSTNQFFLRCRRRLKV